MFVQYENRAFPYSASIVDDLTFLLHLHRQAELIYVLDGCIEMTVDAHTRPLHAGEELRLLNDGARYRAILAPPGGAVH